MLRTSIQKSSKFSHLFTFLFNFSLFLLLRNALSDSLEVEEQGGDPYFGVPLGALHYSAEGTSAEVYAADEFTILFNHFQHNPRQPGCTAMIIGPPRPEDRENVIPGHGIILPMIKSNSFKAKREKREAIKFHRPQQFGGFWPIEFAHLLLEPSREGQEKSGSLNKESQEEKLKRNSTTSFSLPNSNSTTLSSINSTISSTPDLQQKLSNNENTSTTSQTPTISSTTNTLNSNLNTSTHSSLIATTQPLILLGSKRTPTPLINQRNYSIAFLNAKDDAIVEDKIEKGIGSSIRRSPARNEYIGNNVIDIKPPIELTTTPLYQIIKDPRPGRRQRLIELRKKLDPTYEPPAFSTTSAPFSAQEIQYVLPAVRGQLATFTLTNGAKITQYKWIGLWNQCTKRHIPLASLVDVDPPREEKIMPLSGWSHNVTSYRLHILNCNTILIPSFHYDGRNTTKNTYFFVGVGQFPEAVEHQLKANIVGLRQGEPLRSYSGEDVVLRLPRPYRTFDIDFISIFNTDEQKSFGHVLIPSLLVPPC